MMVYAMQMSDMSDPIITRQSLLSWVPVPVHTYLLLSLENNLPS